MKLASQKRREERLPVRAVKGTVFRAEAKTGAGNPKENKKREKREKGRAVGNEVPEQTIR